jgi:HK97 gp10 family phage protein
VPIRIRVVYNKLPKIIDALPVNIDKEVNDAATDIADVLKSRLWVDTGTLRRVTTDFTPGFNHAEVWIGYYLGKGFYSGFQEWGTVKQDARPIVGPTAHQYETVYASNMEKAVRKACGT